MQMQKTFLVFGATGRTGRHFTSLALEGRAPRERALQLPPPRTNQQFTHATHVRGHEKVGRFQSTYPLVAKSRYPFLVSKSTVKHREVHLSNRPAILASQIGP